MLFYYQVFGLTCLSEIEIPFFLPIPEVENESLDFEIRFGNITKNTVHPTDPKLEYVELSPGDFYLYIPEVGKFAVNDGKTITIYPFTDDTDEIMIHLRSNCIIALLHQRNRMVFHVSGVIDGDGVWLFAADSGTGKSTLALKLQEKGFPLFTDDTAVIEHIQEDCYAQASYPMAKAWPDAFETQNYFPISSAYYFKKGVEKFGINFHENFIAEKKKVLGIVFLSVNEEEIQIEKLSQASVFTNLLSVIYADTWITSLKQQGLQFQLLSKIANRIPCWKASRPFHLETFEDFPEMIIKEILSDQKTNRKMHKTS